MIFDERTGAFRTWLAALSLLRPTWLTGLTVFKTAEDCSDKPINSMGPAREAVARAAQPDLVLEERSFDVALSLLKPEESDK